MWKAGSSLVTDRKLQLLTNTSSWSISQWSWWKGLLIHKAVFCCFRFSATQCYSSDINANSSHFQPSHDLYHLVKSFMISLPFTGRIYFSDINQCATSAGLQNNLGLTIQNFNLQFYGRRVFSGATPHLWNHLPEDIKNVDSIRKLQTLLVNRTF